MAVSVWVDAVRRSWRNGAKKSTLLLLLLLSFPSSIVALISQGLFWKRGDVAELLGLGLPVFQRISCGNVRAKHVVRLRVFDSLYIQEQERK